MDLVLLGQSLWQAITTLADEVRRTPAWIKGIMLFIAVVGTLAAQLLR